MHYELGKDKRKEGLYPSVNVVEFCIERGPGQVDRQELQEAAEVGEEGRIVDLMYRNDCQKNRVHSSAPVHSLRALPVVCPL